MKSKYMLIILFAVLIVVFFKMKSNSSKENMSIMKPVSREFFSDEVAPQKDKQLTPQKE